MHGSGRAGPAGAGGGATRLGATTRPTRKKPTPTAVDAAAQDLELIGYVGLADTARPSARPLIEALHQAGRQVVLITGDHPVTARAIARQLGLPADAQVITGAEFAALDEEARARLAADVQVFARVSPEQKVQHRRGAAALRTGDGDGR